jgi:hypothetical protein
MSKITITFFAIVKNEEKIIERCLQSVLPIIDYIVSKVEEYKKYQDYKLNKVINFKQELRDWRINNLLDE